MKKIIIAATAVAVAFGLQAATLDWGVAGVCNPATGEDAPDGWAAYIFAVDATVKSGSETWTTREAVISALEAGLGKDLSGVTALASSDGSATTSTGMVLAYGGSFDVFSQASSAAADNMVTAFAVIFNNEDINKATLAYVTEASTAGIDSFGTMPDLMVLSAAGSDSEGAWVSAVPEPTSGLLLLLGVAGLALKRKRA